jgi:hypothetical protein
MKPAEAPSKEVRNHSLMLSEPTRAGYSPEESSFCPGFSHTDDSSFVIRVHKAAGDVLGLKLFYHSLQVQSIEPGSVLSKHSENIPIGSSISSVNGRPATVRNIRNLLRECRYLTEIYLMFARQDKPAYLRRQSQHRLSQSSATGSNSMMSPSSSQLSSMWRRVSETATLPLSDSGVMPIDFNKLSRDSMGMWTRSMVRDSSLPNLELAEARDSFEEEYDESPNCWRARRRAKRASWSGSYPPET